MTLLHIDKTFSFDYFSGFAKIRTLRDHCMHPTTPVYFLSSLTSSQTSSSLFPSRFP